MKSCLWIVLVATSACSSPPSNDPDAALGDASGDAAMDAAQDAGSLDAASGDAAAGAFSCDQCVPGATYCFSILPVGCTSAACVEVAECRAFPTGCTSCDCIPAPEPGNPELDCACLTEGARISYGCYRGLDP